MIHYKSAENSHSQPPRMNSDGMNLVKITNEDQNKLISIIKSHTADINASLSPRRKTNSPSFVKKEEEKQGSEKSEAKPNGIRATIDASRFFSKPKSKEKSMFNSQASSKVDLDFTRSPNISEINQKVTEIEMNHNQSQNKQLLEFVKVVKHKFSQMESELERTKNELIYFQRKSKEQEETIEELRKREK